VLANLVAECIPETNLSSKLLESIVNLKHVQIIANRANVFAVPCRKAIANYNMTNQFIMKIQNSKKSSFYLLDRFFFIISGCGLELRNLLCMAIKPLSEVDLYREENQ